MLLLVAAFLLAFPHPSSSSSTTTRRFHFSVEWKDVTRLCHSKPLLTVNGQYPGPTISVDEGDHIQVVVTNNAATNTSIHWHGVRQLRTGWADGPAYITQCPIGLGQTFTYDFSVLDQRGTLWWHAHFSWQRASVYGAFIIRPRTPHPSFTPHTEIPIILGEWWNGNVGEIENEMMLYGGGPNSSDAHTINGLPGPTYPCSAKGKNDNLLVDSDTFIQAVHPGKTYLLRIINAALNNELFFSVANHTLTVVEIDAVYTKPFATSAIMLTPGQTTNVLLVADQNPSDSTFVMAARPYVTSIFPFNNSTAIGFLRYETKKSQNTVETNLPDNLPDMRDTAFAARFSNSLRSLGSTEFPCRVPRTIEKRVVATISLNLQDCPDNQTCKGYRNKRFYASMNNQSFVRPSVSLLEARYRDNLTRERLSDFDEKPPHEFNYTGVDPVSENMNTEFGTRLVEVAFGTKLEIVLQDTNFLNPENHPIHLHGHNFFIVGSGFGNFDASVDPDGYNLVDPPERNTVGVPTGGWAAIRINADNPGVWYIHCHLEEHTTWGLAMGLVVRNGEGESQRLLPPPNDMPPC